MPSCRSVPARARSSTGHVPTQRLLRHTALRRVHCRTRRPCVRVAVAGRSCLSVAEIEHDATGSRIVGLPIWGVVRLVAWTGFHHLPGLIAPELRQLLTQERWNSRSRYRGGGLCPRVECVLKLKLVWVGSQNTLAPARGSTTHTHTHIHTHTQVHPCAHLRMQPTQSAHLCLRLGRKSSSGAGTLPGCFIARRSFRRSARATAACSRADAAAADPATRIARATRSFGGFADRLLRCDSAPTEPSSGSFSWPL